MDLSFSLNSKESDFYPIKAKDEKGVRWEEKCKSCKKQLRIEREQKEKLQPLTCRLENSVAPQELQKKDLTEALKQDQIVIEENSLNNDKTTEEGIIKFNKFVSVLLEEYGRQVGASVYVKGKRS